MLGTPLPDSFSFFWEADAFDFVIHNGDISYADNHIATRGKPGVPDSIYNDWCNGLDISLIRCFGLAFFPRFFRFCSRFFPSFFPCHIFTCVLRCSMLCADWRASGGAVTKLELQDGRFLRQRVGVRDAQALHVQ